MLIDQLGNHLTLIALGNSNINAGGVTWNHVTRQFTVTHQYLDDNPSGTPSDNYTISVTATDDDGGVSPTVQRTLTVNNVAPTLVGVALDNSTINENDSVSVRAPIHKSCRNGLG